MGVIVTFAMSIVFSVILPTSDVGSDIYLSYNTVNFVGHDRTLQGCRACFNKYNDDTFYKQEGGCTTCFETNFGVYFKYGDIYHTKLNQNTRYVQRLRKRVSNNEFYGYNGSIYRIYHGDFTCSTSPNILDKIIELNSNPGQCNETIRLFWDGKPNINESGDCQSFDDCCVKRTKHLKKVEFDSDEKISWRHCIQNNHGCEVCLGIGQLEIKSCRHLLDIPDPFMGKSRPYNTEAYPWHIRDRKCYQSNRTTYFKVNDLKLKEGKLISMNYEVGKCSGKDQCCLRFRIIQRNDSTQNRWRFCFQDACSMVLRSAGYYLNNRLELMDWKNMDIYARGQNRGGRICSYLKAYGWLILLPVFFHAMFGLVLYYNDMKTKETSYTELVFALFMVYPQWKVIKHLFRYAVGTLNEEDLHEGMDHLDGNVSSVEPFVESPLQVHISFAVIMTMGGFFPKDEYGVTTTVFDDLTQALPIASFLLSLFASSFGISKFFLKGPLKLISQEAPFSGMLSITFLAHLFVNLSFAFRIYAVESALFSAYRNYSLEFSYEKYGIVTSSIEPIFSYELRILLYLIPILPSMVVNILSLRRSMDFKSLGKLFLNFPQFSISPCFSPLVFEGVSSYDRETHQCQIKIKVWKRGSVVNAIYIGILPQLILIVSDVARGITSLNLIRTVSTEQSALLGYLEVKNSVFNHPYANIIIATTLCMLYVSGILYFFCKGSKQLEKLSDAVAIYSYDTQGEKTLLWILGQPPYNDQSTQMQEQGETTNEDISLPSQKIEDEDSGVEPNCQKVNVNIEEQEEQQTPGALKTGDRRKSSIEQQDESTSTLPEGNRPNPALKCDSHLNDASNNDQVHGERAATEGFEKSGKTYEDDQSKPTENVHE